MTFLSPLFLWGLLALAIPLLVHLFNLRRHKKVYFSQVRFLKAVSQQVNKTRKVKHFLVLLARLLALACLVLALAQPVFKKKEIKIEDLEKPIGIFIDNSYSMQADASNGNPKLSNALSWANDLVKKSPDNSKFVLITNDFSSSDQEIYTKTSMLDRLAEIDYSNSFKTSAQLSERLKQSDFKIRNLLVLSDFQKSTFYDLNRMVSDTSQKFTFVPFSSAKHQNIFIDTVSLLNPNVIVGETNTLLVKVKNSAAKEKAETKIRLFMNNAMLAQKNMEIESGESKSVEFTFKINDAKTQECKLVLEDEQLIFDNEFYFTLQPNPDRKVVIISSSPSKKYFQKAFSLESFFKVFDFEFGKIDYGQLSKADVIVIDGMSRMDKTLVDYAKTALENDAVIIMIPDSKINAISSQFYSGLFPRLANLVTREIAKDEEALPLASPDLSNPFFEQIFSQKIERMVAAKAKRTIENLPGEKILSFSDGSPFLTRLNSKPGNLFLFASSLEDEFSDFGKNALFLPVLYKMATFGKSEKDKLFYNVGYDFMKINLNTDTLTISGNLFSLESADKNKFLLPQQLNANQLVLKSDKTLNKSGIYQLKLGEKSIKPIAINTDKRESEIETFTKEELEKLSATFKNIELADLAETPSELLMTQMGLQEHLNLWRYFLTAALFFLFVEMLIIRLFK
ncbi:MAG: BatA domain-containing protein [Cytophagales bacterium]